jgi:hypothetical protein
MLYAAVALYLTRGVTFTVDQLTWFADADGYSPGTLLEPHNDHIIAVTRLLFTASLDLFGAEHLPLRIAMIATAIVAVVAFWALLRERIGGLAALVPAAVLLFLGSVPEPLLLAMSPFVQATTAGLLAILALERRRLGWDLLACALLVLSVASFAVGAALAFGIGVWLALAPGGRRRLWVVAVPLALFAAWWIWSRQFDQSVTTGSLLLFPSFAADSLAAALAAFSGLAIDFETLEYGEVLPLGWGRPLALVLLAVLGWRLRRNPAGPLLAGLAAALVALWAAGSLSTNALRPPEAGRYAYPVVVLVALIVAETFRGARIRPRALVALAAAGALALAGNLYLLRDRAADLRSDSAGVEAALATLELQGERANQAFEPPFGVTVRAGDYLAAAERHGSLALRAEELGTAPEPAQRFADAYGADLGAVRLEPASAGAETKDPACESSGGANSSIPLPAGGAIVTSESGGDVLLGRFAERPHDELGTLPAGTPTLLRVPDDADATPWRIAVAAAGPVTVCPLG